MPKPPPVVVTVAVAVIHYQDEYLLGFRHASQHQGNCYEFVGGKIEQDEPPIVALIREVGEETGIDISDTQANMIIKLGRLHHDYGDKHVHLQVYRVTLTAVQYKKYRHCEFGLEGQAMVWVRKTKLLAGAYPLPAANQTILAWLQLPIQIAITYPLAYFNADEFCQTAWLSHHQQHLPIGTWVYIRAKNRNSVTLAAALMRLRSDIQALIPIDNLNALNILDDLETVDTLPCEERPSCFDNQIKAYHLSHFELMTWFHALTMPSSQSATVQYTDELSDYCSKNHPASHHFLIISCHDNQSIEAANWLAAQRVQQNLPPVVAIFLSPVLATKTHPDATPLGWQAWSLLAQLADMPVIALGGLSPEMREQAARYGASGVAGIRQFHEDG